MKDILNYVNSVLGTDYNGILVNKYANGCDYIGAHSDDESALSNIGVASISVGSSRKFRIRDKITKKIILDYATRDDEILVMSGHFQKEFTHEIPAQKRIIDARYSLTFRKHLI